MSNEKKSLKFCFLLFVSVLLALSHTADARMFWAFKGVSSCPNMGFCGWWDCGGSSDCDYFSNADCTIPESPGCLCGPSEGDSDHKKCFRDGGREVSCAYFPTKGTAGNDFRCTYAIPAGSSAYCRGDSDCCTNGADCYGWGSPTVKCVSGYCVDVPPTPPTISSLVLRLKTGSTTEYECAIKVTDPNAGDILTATYERYKNGDIQPPLHRTMVVPNGLEKILSTMQASDMGNFMWKYSASVSDGTFTSAVSYSNSLSACAPLGQTCEGGPNSPGTCCGALVCSALTGGTCIDCDLRNMACNGGPNAQGSCCVGYKCSAASGTCLCGQVGAACVGSGKGTCCFGSCSATTGICACGQIYEDCGANSDCCTGMRCTGTKCQLNRPPNKPQTPSIGINMTDGKIICTNNCPPTTLPTDPDPSDTVTMSYSWNNGAPQTIAGTYDCRVCAPGTTVTFKSIACDQFAPPACIDSNVVSLTIPTPPVFSQSYLNYIIYALVAAFSILALAYMLSKIFNLPHWVPIIGDELLQVLATGGVAVLLVSMQYGIDGYLMDAFYAAGGTGVPTSGYAAAQNYLGVVGGNAENLLNTLSTRSTDIGREASKGIYCTMLGAGFTLPSCSPLNAFRGSLTSAAFTTMVGVVDIYAQQFILAFGHNYAFTFLLPLGLFFRCFKLSRQAGGAFIAIAVGFYTVYPLSIIAVSGALGGVSYPYTPPAIPSVPQLSGADHTCDPYEFVGTANWDQFNDYLLALSDNDRTVGLTYLILVKIILLSVLNLLITLGFIAAFAKILGSDIDVSALARIS